MQSQLVRSAAAKLLTQHAVALRVGSEKGSALLSLAFQSGGVLLQALLALRWLFPVRGGRAASGLHLHALPVLRWLLPVPDGAASGRLPPPDAAGALATSPAAEWLRDGRRLDAGDQLETRLLSLPAFWLRYQNSPKAVSMLRTLFLSGRAVEERLKF